MARTAKDTVKSISHRWSQAQREKYMRTQESKRQMRAGNAPVLEAGAGGPQIGAGVTQAAEARAGGYSFPTRQLLDIAIPAETLANRRLGEVIQAAEVLGFHVEIRVRSNGRSNQNGEHAAQAPGTPTGLL